MNLFDRLLIMAVTVMVIIQLVFQAQYHKEALDRHATITQMELQNQKAFNASIKSSVDDLERAYQQKGKEIQDRRNDNLTGPTVETHP